MKNFTIACCAIIASTIGTTIAQAQEKEYNLKLNGNEVNLVGEALGALPYTKVVPLMNKLQQQLREQDRPVVEAPKKDSSKPE